MKKLFVLLFMLALVTAAFAGTDTSSIPLYKPAQGETGWTNSVNNNFDVLDELFSGVDSSEYGSLASAISAASGKMLYITKDYTISSNTTIPADVVLVPVYPNTLTVTGGYTLTINGRLVMPDFQFIDGTGTVVFGSGAVKEIDPRWWGADPTDSSDDSTEVNAAMTAADGKAPIVLSSGTWTLQNIQVKTNVYMSDGVTINQGNTGYDVFVLSETAVMDGGNATVNMIAASTKSAFVVKTPGGSHHMHTRIRNFFITGQSGHTANGFLIQTPNVQGIDDLLIENIYARFLESAVRFDTSGGGWINGNTFRNFWVSGCTYGIDFDGQTPITGNVFDSIRGQYEASDPTDSLFHDVSGERNTFVGCSQWDGGKTFDMNSDSKGNLSISPVELLAYPNNVISDQGGENMFFFPYMNQAIFGMREDFSGAALTNRWHTSAAGSGSTDVASGLDYGGALLTTGSTALSNAIMDFNGKATYSGNHKARINFSTKTYGSIYNVKIEFGMQKAGDPDNRICFRYDDTVSYNWIAVTANGSGTETTTDTGFAYGSAQNFQITKIDTTKALFFGNGNVLAEISTNIFGDDWEPFVYIENSAAETKSIQIMNMEIRLF